MLWLLEDKVFGPGEAPLRAAALRAGHRVISWQDDWWAEPEAMPDASDDKVVFHGSLANADRIASLGRWNPGAYCNTARLACAAWYPRFSEWVANSHYLISTVRELTADPIGVASGLKSKDGTVFVRPNSPLKPFSGRVVTLEGLTPAQLDHGTYYDDLDLPIVLASSQRMGHEWRFVVVNGEVVAKSAYRAEDRSADTSEVPGQVTDLACTIAAAHPLPDKVCILDLAETPRGLRLIELTPFSGADLYACDLDAVVAAVAAAQ